MCRFLPSLSPPPPPPPPPPAPGTQWRLCVTQLNNAHGLIVVVLDACREKHYFAHPTGDEAIKLLRNYFLVKGSDKFRNFLFLIDPNILL